MTPKGRWCLHLGECCGVDEEADTDIDDLVVEQRPAREKTRVRHKRG